MTPTSYVQAFTIEKVWIYNEVISVRKNASSPKIEIFSESDLDLLI